MTVSKGAALSLFVLLASIVAGVSGRAAAGASVAGPRLTAISSRVHSKGASLVIQATAPVPYIAPVVRTTGASGDAMKALERVAPPPAADPIAALGLDRPVKNDRNDKALEAHAAAAATLTPKLEAPPVATLTSKLEATPM